jgi:hypothetical protein
MRALKPLSLLFAVLMLGCGIGDVSISIAPRSATVNANGQVQFSAGVGGAGNKQVSWSCSSGQVTATGLYTAPELPATCSVTATSQADPSKTATATVTVVAPVVLTPSLIQVTPGGTQSFTAVVVATGDTNVIWSIQEGATGGTITTGGLYTAPTESGIYHVVATSVADPTQFGVAIVTVTPAV